jgi:hypothetical protein
MTPGIRREKKGHSLLSSETECFFFGNREKKPYKSRWWQREGTKNNYFFHSKQHQSFEHGCRGRKKRPERVKEIFMSKRFKPAVSRVSLVL